MGETIAKSFINLQEIINFSNVSFLNLMSGLIINAKSVLQSLIPI